MKKDSTKPAQPVVLYEDPVYIDELEYYGPEDGMERVIVDFTETVKKSKPGYMRDLIRLGWVVELESSLSPGMFRMKMPKEKWQKIQDDNLKSYQTLLQGMPTSPDPRTAMTGRVELSNEVISTEELLHFAQAGKAPIASDE